MFQFGPGGNSAFPAPDQGTSAIPAQAPAEGTSTGPAFPVLPELDLNLLTVNEIATSPLAMVSVRLENSFNKLVKFLDEARDRMPPIAMHGTTVEGFEGLIHDRAPSGETLWFTRLISQDPDTRIMGQDLLNCALKADQYTNTGSLGTDGGILMFTMPPPETNVERYRSMLNDDHSLVNQFGRGAFSERAILPFSAEKFNDQFIGALNWAATEYTLSNFESLVNPDDPVAHQRYDLFNRARGIYAVAAAIELLNLNSRAPGAFAPVQVREEMYADTFNKSKVGAETCYTYPDGYKVFQGRDGIRGEAPSPSDGSAGGLGSGVAGG